MNILKVIGTKGTEGENLVFIEKFKSLTVYKLQEQKIYFIPRLNISVKVVLNKLHNTEKASHKILTLEEKK